MVSLPQLSNLIILVDIKGNQYECKALNLDDMAELSLYEKDLDKKQYNQGAGNVKSWLYALYLSMKKCNSDVTQEYVNDLFTLDDVELLKTIGTKVGFIVAPAKAENATPTTENLPTGDTSTPELQPVPDTISEPSVS